MQERRLLRQRRHRMTVEKLANECLAARDLKRAGLLRGPWVTVRPFLRWPGVERMRAARYSVILELRNQSVPQQIRVSWTHCHFGGARPWLHCITVPEAQSCLLRFGEMPASTVRSLMLALRATIAPPRLYWRVVRLRAFRLAG